MRFWISRWLFRLIGWTHLLGDAYFRSEVSCCPVTIVLAEGASQIQWIDSPEVLSYPKRSAAISQDHGCTCRSFQINLHMSIASYVTWSWVSQTNPRQERPGKAHGKTISAFTEKRQEALSHAITFIPLPTSTQTKQQQLLHCHIRTLAPPPRSRPVYSSSISIQSKRTTTNSSPVYSRETSRPKTADLTQSINTRILFRAVARHRQ
jgi:hypothetical protein